MSFPNRKPTRLKNYDYSTPGAYFITICVKNMQKVLSDIVGEGSPLPKKYGKTVIEYIEKINQKYPTIFVDKYVVMPNHIHLLLTQTAPYQQDGRGDPSPTNAVKKADIEAAMGWFKYSVTKEINKYSKTPGKQFFQRSFHDHIIRGEADYKKIWNYIDTNPQKWKDDCFYS